MYDVRCGLCFGFEAFERLRLIDSFRPRSARLARSARSSQHSSRSSVGAGDEPAARVLRVQTAHHGQRDAPVAAGVLPSRLLQVQRYALVFGKPSVVTSCVLRVAVLRSPTGASLLFWCADTTTTTTTLFSPDCQKPLDNKTGFFNEGTDVDPLLVCTRVRETLSFL